MLAQIVHRQMDAMQLASGDQQVPSLGCAAGQTHRIEVGEEILRRIVYPNVNAGTESYPFLDHQVDPAAHHRFVQLEIRNAQRKQAPDIVGPLQDRNPVAGAVELLSRRQAGGARADYRHPLAGAVLRWFRLDPALVKPPVGDFFLNVLDGHRVRVDTQNAGSFAGSRADAAGKLREVVGGQ